MEKLFTEALKIKTLLGAAIFSLIVVVLFKDNIQAVALAGDNDALSLLLGFLFFMVVGVLGIAAFYAISAKEIAGEKGRPIARVKGSEDVTGQQTGTDGLIDVQGSKRVSITQQGSSALNQDPEKKLKSATGQRR